MSGELLQLYRIAIKEAQAYEKMRGHATREQIRSFESAIDTLASADKWEIRLSGFWKTLKPASARSALKDLVKLGCVPDMLVDCLNEQRTEEASRRDQRTRLNEHRNQMKIVARQMNRLADLCDDWNRLRLTGVGGAYHLDWKISRFLWNEAQRIDAFVAASDPRTNHPLTRAESSLFQTMRDTRMITGEYQDRLLAAFLRPAFPTSADALKKFRTRRAAAWSLVTSKRPLLTAQTDEFPKLVSA